MGLTLDDITRGYSPDEGSDMEVRGPDGQVVRDESGNPATIRLAGVDSQIYRETRSKLSAHKAKLLHERRSKRLSPEEEDDQAVEMAARCTLGWENLDLPFSVEKARELYRSAPYIRDDAIVRIHDREAYLRE